MRGPYQVLGARGGRGPLGTALRVLALLLGMGVATWTAGPGPVGARQPGPAGAQASSAAGPVGAEVDTGFPQEQAAADTPDESGLITVRSAYLELQVDRESGRVDVTDLRNGLRWSSVPELPPGVRIVGLWRGHIDNNFILEYAEPDYRPKGMLNASRYDVRRQVLPIERGARVEFQLFSPSGDRDYAFAMEFRLGDDYLDLRIPFDSVAERAGGPKLLSLTPMPFFGAANDRDKGYAFYPDGAGAISRFKEDHPEYRTNFREWVYQMGAGAYARGGGQVRMPVFGIRKEIAAAAGAFVGFITAGDKDAQIEFSPSGYVLALNRVAPILYFRHRFTVALRRDAFVDKVSQSLIEGDRSVRYVFLNGEDADYSGMARAYRQWLLEAGWLRKAVPDGFSGYLSLDLFMGVEKPMVIWRSLVTMTTFDQARWILEDLKKRGVERLEVVLRGWNHRGFIGAPPERLPPDERLGGTEGLLRLAEFARGNGIGLWLYDQFFWVAEGAEGYSTRSDLTRTASREPYWFSRSLSPVPSLTEEQVYFLLNPLAALRIADRDLPKMRELGVKGLVEETIGQFLHQDYNPERPLSRGQWAEALLELADRVKANGLSLATVKGNVFLLGKVELLEEVAMVSSRHLFADATVPFFQLVVHGYVPYTPEEYGNLRSEPLRQRLRSIEYGALPAFQLTYEETSRLTDTWVRELYSTQYGQWAEQVAEEYQELIGRLGYLQGVPMYSHQELAEGVYEVRYEDGSRVYVNYSEQPYPLPPVEAGTQPQVVPSVGYLLIPGERAPKDGESGGR